MLEFAIAIAFIGLAAASAWDLKTTEVPDEIPALMISSGIFIWFMNAMLSNDFSPLIYSLAIGTVLLSVGLILYKQGKWGGADAWILGAVAYLIPLYNGQIFMLPFIFNLLFAGSAYMAVYAIVLGFRNKNVAGLFLKDLKEHIRFVTGIPLAFLLLVIALGYFSYSLTGYVNAAPLVSILVLITGLTLFWRYAKIIENNVFKKRIPVSQLRSGDVLDDMIWRGLTLAEVAELKKQKKYVIVKEGVRFIPAFLIALIISLLYGNLLLMMI
jgi:Flp pilus assembly protein protease CpaA